MHAFGYDDDGDNEAENNTDVDDKRFKLTDNNSRNLMAVVTGVKGSSTK